MRAIGCCASWRRDRHPRPETADLLSIRQPLRFRRSTIGGSSLIRPRPNVEAPDGSNFLGLDGFDNRGLIRRQFLASPVSDLAGNAHIENRKIVWICDRGVYPEIASAAVLNHFDRYVVELKGLLT